MSIFRRRRDGEDDATGLDDEPRDEDIDEEVDLDEPDEPDDEPAAPRAAGRPDGPWDVVDVAEPGEGRVDLGGLWIPMTDGLELRVEADQTTGVVLAVTLVLGDSALQLQPFAAPKSEGIWPEVRGEIRTGITQDGGTAEEAEGPFGTELQARVSVRAQDGRTGVEPARFLGVDGPRWFLRGVLTGRAALDQGADDDLLALLREVVVVRGSSPMAPRELIPLRLPDEPGDEAEPAEAGDPLSPFARGPEITEIR